MSDESPDPELVLRAEAQARELPLAEPEWERLATSIEARLSDAPASDDALFAAPLPEPGAPEETAPIVAAPVVAAPEELAPVLATPVVAPPAEVAAAVPGVDTAVAKGPSPDESGASQREPVSLADLARASVARRGANQSSGIARESLALASQSRGQGGEVAERVDAAARGSARSAITLPPARPRGDSRGPWVGVAIAAIGLAAGFGLYVTGRQQAPAVVIQQVPAPGAAAASPAPENVAPTATAAEPRRSAGATAGPGVAEEPHGVALDALSTLEPTKATPPSAARSATPTTASSKAAQPERVVLEEEGAATPAPLPGKVARPAESALLKPAELNRESGVADRPSAGAAQAAVGAVLGAARSCIAGHPRPSTATIVFGSSGEVSSVSVGGPAAGTPAAGCVEAALKKARVQPFAAPTFSLGVTVRPP